MPYTEPTIDDLRFAEDDVVDPTSGVNNAIEPSAGKKDNGFTRSESPPRQDFNWLYRMIWQFCRWAHDELMHPGQVGGTSGLGTAAGKDTGTATGTVPEHTAAKTMDVDRINGSVSHLTDTGTVTTDHLRQVNAGESCSATGEKSQVNASSGCSCPGIRAQVNASYNSEASGGMAAVDASFSCYAEDGNSKIIASRYVKTGAQYTLTGGYAASSPASSANRKWEIDSQTGAFRSVLAAGSSFVSSYTFADFGEYFENLTMGVIPLGTIVALEGDKIKPAKEDDIILGTISATTAFVGANSDFQWQGRFLKGEFGESLYDEIVDPDFKGEGEAPKIWVQKENPEYNPSRENIPRSDRPEEYSCVALLGQVHVRVGKDVKTGNYVAADGGKSAKETRLLCMAIKQEFDMEKGYAVALCLLR
jgi:hypothetical protein